MTQSRLAAGFVLLALSAASNAAIVTVDGDNVRFTYDDSTMYGTAIVVGNTILFQPTDFRAESLDGAGTVSMSETLNITVEAITPGFLIEEAILVEQGDYFRDQASSTVNGSGRLQVTSSTTNCEFGVIPCTSSDAFDFTGLDTVGSLTNWNAGTQINLADTAGWGADSEVTVQIQNNLSATTVAEISEAFIQKKFGAVGLSIVPIPPAVWLFGSGLVGLAGWARRRKLA